MKKVSNLLHMKGNTVCSIDSKSTVYEALELMVQKNIGSLIVIKNGRFSGLITERDYARKVVLHGKLSKETTVEEIMETNPPTVSLNDSIEHCMHLMSDNNIRYLPVKSEDHVVGMVAMTDVVRFIIDDQRNTIQNLHNYISGSI